MLTVELDEGDAARALRASVDAELGLVWNHLAVNGRAKVCGLPFGLGDRTFEPWPYRRVFDGASTCGRVDCPNCGREILLRRWAATTLVSAEHLARPGAEAWFVSIAGQHSAGEDVAVTAGRLWAVVEVVVGKALREWAGMLGLRGWVRTIEPTFGGRNGIHPNAHFLILIENPDLGGLWEDAGQMLRAVIWSSLIDWAYGVRLTRPNRERIEVVRHFVDGAALDARPAGVTAAGYMTKLGSEAQEVAGIGFEMTDPSGAKDRGGVGDRAWCGWAARRCREAGYGGRRLRAGLLMVPEVRETAGQYRRWVACTKGRRMWAHTRGMFAVLDRLPVDELLARASAVAHADDWQQVLTVLGLVAGPMEPGEPGDGREGPVGGGGGPFDDDGPADPPPATPDETVRIDAAAVAAWFDDLDDPTVLGGVDGACARQLTTSGPWRTLLDINEASRRLDGRELVVLERVDLDDVVGSTVWLTGDDVGGQWDLVDWAEVARRACRSGRWTIPTVAGREGGWRRQAA